MDSRISARSLAASLGGWRSKEPVYEALADGIRLLCLDNRIAPRTALPAERELSAELRLSRTTVAAAYRSLRDTGHIESVRGSGSITLPLRRTDPGHRATGDETIDLQQASPPAWPGLAGVITEVAAGAATLVSTVGYDIVGRPGLRDAIAARYTARGIPTSPDEVMITTGAQSAIHLIASVLLGRADRVLIETPTYPHAADAFRRAGARMVGVPVTTSDGWDLDRAEQAFARTLPVLAYLMPDFQNPTGRTMTAQERAIIAAAADRSGTLVVVDETTSDLNIDRAVEPEPFGRGEDLIRLGSLGKTVWGGLRIGWIRAEVELIRRLVSARAVHDLGTPEIEQAVAEALLPRLDEIAHQRAHLLRQGRDAVSAALRDRLPQWRVPAADGGVSLWVELDAPLSSGLVMAARARGLYLSAGSRFAVEGGYDRHLRVPFTAPAASLVSAVSILEQVWPTVHDGAPRALVDSFDAVV
ncbi:MULTISPECIES: PLP-dependent aminotransferase family protein [unclassified Microbacterium]|uniref:MocR-like transcription factor YczR n=1 Tax=unclassified Microbacterium TaxID=2609290 RepID=UPI000D5753CC|nr:PLP-dependent aminotransferase family protein [Microbacterium sp. Gd 4-13]PVW06461.1 PLP-dependent aminotransferase family protein [Microbacterium sp. Gd 4-13]